MDFKQNTHTPATEPWTEERTAALRALWAQQNPQLSQSAIGRILGVSKDSIRHKAERLGLQSRLKPSPPAPTPTPVATSLAPIAADEDPNRLNPFYYPPLGNKCAWPSGKNPVRFECEREALEGKPYCAHHQACAFGRVVLEESDK